MKYRTTFHNADVWNAEITEFPETVSEFLKETEGQFGTIRIIGRAFPIEVDFGERHPAPDFPAEIMDARIRTASVSDSWGFNRYLIEIY